MLKITTKDALRLHDALKETQALKKLPAKLLGKFSKNLRLVEVATETYHSARNQLMEQLGTPNNERPGTFNFTHESARKFIDGEKYLQTLVHELDLATIAWKDVEEYQAATAGIATEGFSPGALAGFAPILEGSPSE